MKGDSMELPENVGYGKVVGRFTLAVATGTEETRFPRSKPASGKVTFTPAPLRLLNVTADPPVTIIPQPIVCTLDDEGHLIDPELDRGVWLIATDDDDNNPVDWPYQVEVTLEGIRRWTFNMQVPEDATIDLTTVLPVAGSKGSAIVRGPRGPAGGIDEAAADGRYVHKATAPLADKLLPIATPTGDLEFETKSQGFDPSGLGVDGYVYFRFNSNKMVRSNDGLATYEISTQEWPERAIYWCGRVREGYTAFIKESAGVTGVWHCPGDDWNGIWTHVETIGHMGILSMPRPVQRPGAGTVLVVPEYTATQPGTGMSLWVSTDGGATWAKVRTIDVKDSGINAHWHGAIFDPLRERIWASNGDGPNSWFGYSDDLGSTWVGVPFDTDDPLYDGSSIFQQPTLLIDFGEYVALSPDRGPFTPGMWQMDAASGRTVERTPVPGMEGHNADRQFGLGGYYAQRGPEAYVTFPDTGSGNKTTFIMATGDAGRTWHLAYTFPWIGSGSASIGMSGPDASGHLYFKPSNSGTMVARALGWSYSTR